MKTFSPALLTDLYELTMAQAYFEQGMSGQAVFSLFVRRLPPRRNYLLACGLDDALSFLEAIQFDPPALTYLESQRMFSPRFLAYLENLRFTGQVRAVPEGTPLFANEPILEVTAPIIEGQIVETLLMNQVHLQIVLASKAARVVAAAAGRQVVDFGLRRMHGIDAGFKAARAFHIAGVDATSNVAAGQVYGLRIAGTMAHSYVQAHESEYAAFRDFARQYPETVLLVDSYDTIEGVRKVIDLAKELGPAFRVKAIRLDSGDLRELSIRARELLDAAGLQRVGIFASGNLDENLIAALIAGGAPIDGFGVGTEMGVSPDAPVVDIAYKLVEYERQGRVKLAPEKSNLPGSKQVFRIEIDGVASHDVIAAENEAIPGRPLLHPVMVNGERLPAGKETLDDARARTKAELNRLPSRLRALDPADPPYEVRVSAKLTEEAARLRQHYSERSRR
jgi:nicotinate phosphoribosyltransferase